MKRFLSRIGSSIVFLLCGVISLFLLASGYESVFSRSLPVVRTIEPINLTALSSSYDIDHAILGDKDDPRYGSYGKPQTIKFPERAARLDIVQPLKDESGKWLARSNGLHILAPEKARNGSLGITLLYCRAGARTISADVLPAIGSNLFMDTDRSWRYVYKVTSTAISPASQAYVLADGGNTSKLLISCFDDTKNNNVYLEANLLSVQGTDV